jgi:hypothetical protein
MKKVSAPAAMPAMPTMASHQRGIGLPPFTAATIASTPSTSANAPQNSTSVSSTMPGQAKARIPRMMAATPRSTSSHQFLASACKSDAPGASEPGACGA